MDYFDQLPQPLQDVVGTHDTPGLDVYLYGEVRFCYIALMLTCVQHVLVDMFAKVYDVYSTDLTKDDLKQLISHASDDTKYIDCLKHILQINPCPLTDSLDPEYWYALMVECLRNKRYCVMRHLVRAFPIDFEHRSSFWFNKLKFSFDQAPFLNSSRIRLLHEYKFSSESGMLEGEKFRLDLMGDNLWDVEDVNLARMKISNGVIAPWTNDCGRQQTEEDRAYTVRTRINHYLYETKQKIHFLRDLVNKVGVQSLILPGAPDTETLASAYMEKCIEGCADYDSVARALLPGVYRENVTEEFAAELPEAYSRASVLRYLTKDRKAGALDPVLENFLWNGFGLLHGSGTVDVRSLQTSCVLGIYKRLWKKDFKETKLAISSLGLPPALESRLQPELTEQAVVRKRDYIFKTFNDTQEASFYGKASKPDEYSPEL